MAGKRNKKVDQDLTKIVENNIEEAKKNNHLQKENEITVNDENNAANIVLAKRMIKGKNSKNNSNKTNSQKSKPKKDFKAWGDDKSEKLEVKTKKPTSIKLPYPGQSYNPSKTDVDSLAKVVNAAKKEEVRKKKLQKNSSLHKLPKQQLEKNLYKELTCGIIENDDEIEVKNAEKMVIKDIKINNTKQTTKKPVSSKQRRHLEKVKASEEKKQQRKQEIEIAKELKSLKKKLKEQTLIMPTKPIPKANKRTVMKYGPQKFKESVPVIHRNQREVSRTLLRMKPQQDLLNECFENVKRKGLVETRKVVKKSKHKLRASSNRLVEEETKKAYKELDV